MGYALLVTVIAGLSTTLGSLFVMLIKKPKESLVSASLGFAGGVMLTVALADMLPEAVEEYAQVYSKQKSAIFACSLFMLGMVMAFLLVRLLPSSEQLLAKAQTKTKALAARTALVTVVVVTVHNLPEGIITLFTSYAMPSVGITLAIAIALHNIPEGIAISVPVYYATGSRLKAFLASFLSGICEPIGAVLTFLVLKQFISGLFLTGLLAVIGGIMACVSLIELLPGGFEQSEKKYCAGGAVAGVLIMSIGIFSL